MRMRLLASLAGALLSATAALAQEYPTRPVTMVMPYAAGGPGDTITRILGQSMSTILKQQVIVENRAGAGGTTGSASVATANPDGYTLLLIHIAHATNPALYKSLKYNPETDFEPIGLVTELPSAFVARKSIAANTFAEFIAHVKANRDKVNYSHAGVGSAAHLCGLMFSAAIDTKFTQIAYPGSGPAMNDLMGGQVDFMCDQAVNVVSNVNAGTIKAFAVTGKEAAAALPGVPPADSAGLPGFDLKIWYGLFAPKGTPKPVQDKLVTALQAALKDKFVIERLGSLGAEVVSQERATPAALKAHLASEIEKWGKVIRAGGVVQQ